MAGKLAGILATAGWLLYVGFLAFSVFASPLLVIVGGTAALALIDLWQTEFQRRESSIRRG